MNKKFKFIFLMSFILLFCSACDGDVTRDLRHDGFNYGSEFNCKYFFPADKEDTSYKKIKYITGTHIIDTNGKLYEISLGQSYANDQNCKEAETQIEVKAIMDGSIVKGTDNKYYYLTAQNNVIQYSEVPTTDNNYYTYDILLKSEDVIKVVTANSSTGLYYILKNDGNVYGVVVSRADRNSPAEITSNAIVYNQADYGGAITDFNYAGESTTTFVRTASKLYKMYMTNSAECSKYADVTCKYEMKEDETFNKYSDRIIAYSGSTLITDYKRVFSA